jgi:AI-2 transport protein TqsA
MSRRKTKSPTMPPVKPHPRLPPRDGRPRGLFIAAAAVIVAAGLKLGQPILLPIVLALFLTILSLPVLNLFRRRLPFPAAVGLTVLVDLALLVAFGYVVSLALSRVTARLPAFQVRIQERLGDFVAWLTQQGIPVPEAASLVDTVSGAFLGPLVDLVSGTFLRAASILAAAVVILLLLLFMLFESGGVLGKLRRVSVIQSHALDRYRQITHEVQRYLFIKTVVSLVTGILVGVWVHLVGLEFPFLLGLIAFVLNYIPNLGSILAAAPAVLLGLLQLTVPATLLVLLGYLAINFFLGNLVEPAVLGRRLRISPLVVFVSLLVWGFLWGPLGMLLAVPITMVVKILLENSERYLWLAALLDPPVRGLRGRNSSRPPRSRPVRAKGA